MTAAELELKEIANLLREISRKLDDILAKLNEPEAL